MQNSDPVLRAQTLDELQGFFPNYTREQLDEKLEPILRFEEWRNLPDHEPATLAAFYRNTEGLIFDLSAIRTIPQERDKARLVTEFCRQYVCHRILDYAGGVGEDILQLAELGEDCTLVDMGKTLEFAKYRFQRRGLAVKAYDFEDFLKNNSTDHYTAIICLEFWEHVPEPLEYARLFYKMLQPKGILVTNTLSFSEHDTGHLPQHYHFAHISNPQGDPYALELINIGYKMIWADQNLFSMQVFGVGF